MKKRTMDEMIAYFNQQISEMDIDRKYKMALLGMITAIGYEASAQPERKTGKWIVVSDGYGNGEATACICECSECKDTIWVYRKANRKWNYCPNCGAIMEAEDG